LLNLEELVNAAAEAQESGETLRDFLDRSALTADTDKYQAEAQVTLMTMHAAKGLEFPLVFIVGFEEGVFPHSRASNDDAELEEERRLCYVAITRAEKYLYLTHAQTRRVYGEEMPAEPSRFLNEFPRELLDDLSQGSSWLRHGSKFSGMGRTLTATPYPQKPKTTFQGKTYNDQAGIKEFLERQAKQAQPAKPTAKIIGKAATSEIAASGYRSNQRVKHAKYGQGLIVRVEGEGEDAKLTINFPGYGMKKLVAKYAGLEKL
jgi:DNA helicase-2/ATP-dependent DNA helicase PcrA